jgi:hypothetical protein
MTKINEMLEAAGKVPAISSNARLHMELAHAAHEAIPDIKRIVEWVREEKWMQHINGCYKYNEEGEGRLEVCTCGLSEIQSLIRR